MLTLRRSRHPVRVEMTPLIDVIFLLLTFFIYSLVVTVRAQVMPVTLTPIAGTSAQSSPADIDAITIGRDGKFYFNQTPVPLEELPKRLATHVASNTDRRLFIAMEAQGDTDRGPLLIKLIEQLRKAGIEDFAIVGQPEAAPTTPTTSTTPPKPASSPTSPDQTQANDKSGR